MFETDVQFVETGWASVKKHDEKLCGDFLRIFENGSKKVFVLSDGLGSGVKANILSTLTATILGTMLSRGIPLDECISTVATTLPICRTRKMAYSTFTVLQLERNEAYLVQYANTGCYFITQRQKCSLPSQHPFHWRERNSRKPYFDYIRKHSRFDVRWNYQCRHWQTCSRRLETQRFDCLFRTIGYSWNVSCADCGAGLPTAA